MRITLVVNILLGLSSLANAQANTFTQMNTFPCSAAVSGLPPCKVSFPQPFGGNPSVTVMMCITKNANIPNAALNAVSQCSAVNPQSITPTGFTVQRLSLSPGESGGDGNGIWVATGPTIFTGTASVKYLVLTVLYAPPGTTGTPSSSVSYSTGSTAGSTVSATQSFTTGSSISYQGSSGTIGGVDAQFDYTTSVTDQQSIDFKQSATTTLGENGPTNSNGINHDEDLIYVLLNPQINLSLSTSVANWSLGGSQAVIFKLFAGWLNGDVQIPSNVVTTLQGAGITSSDFPCILASDPLATSTTPCPPGSISSGGTMDPTRYVSLNTTIPYEPPLAAGDPISTTAFMLSNSTTDTNQTTAEDTYKVGMTLSGGVDFLGLASEKLSDQTSWSWTNKSSQSTTSSTSDTASATISGPGFGYTGPLILQLYFDTIYRTFAFALVSTDTQNVAVDGTLVTSGRGHLKGTEVDMVENGKTYRTFTNSKGQFQFYGNHIGPAEIVVEGTRHSITQRTGSRKIQVPVP